LRFAKSFPFVVTDTALKNAVFFAPFLVKWTLGEVGKSKIKSQSAK
jgi:hypothetical protein